MEQVTVRTYRESSFPMRYGADYVRRDGTRIEIVTGQGSDRNAKYEVQRLVTECEWGAFVPDRKDGFIEVGYGWIDVEDPMSSGDFPIDMR